jgi:hypothetical protein
MPVLVGTDPLVDEGFPTDVVTQAILGDSGIVFADGSIEDEHGCRWKFAPTNAWGPKPAPKEQTGDLEYADGQWDATKYYGPRVTPIPGSVRAPSHAALHAAEQRLRDAVGIEPFTYRVIEPGFDGYSTVRQQGAVEWTENRAGLQATWMITLYGRDPLIYSTRERTFDLSFPVTTGGLVWPATWPATWDTDEVSGSVILSNPSRRLLPLELHVQGPVDTLAVSFPDTGETFNLSDPDGPPMLTAGQWLYANTGTREVLLMGDSRRRSWAWGTPGKLLLPPGETTLAISGTGTTSDSYVSGLYRVARL